MGNLSSVIDALVTVPFASLGDEEIESEIVEIHVDDQRLAARKVDIAAAAERPCGA